MAAPKRGTVTAASLKSRCSWLDCGFHRALVHPLWLHDVGRVHTCCTQHMLASNRAVNCWMQNDTIITDRYTQTHTRWEYRTNTIFCASEIGESEVDGSSTRTCLRAHFSWVSLGNGVPHTNKGSSRPQLETCSHKWFLRWLECPSWSRWQFSFGCPRQWPWHSNWAERGREEERYGIGCDLLWMIKFPALQGVHTETIFELVWLNCFTKLVSRNSTRSHCSFGTSLCCLWLHTRQLSTKTMDLFLVAWAKMTLLHRAKNHHFVLAFIQAATTVAKLFSTFAWFSHYSQTGFNSHCKVSWVWIGLHWTDFGVNAPNRFENTSKSVCCARVNTPPVVQYSIPPIVEDNQQHFRCIHCPHTPTQGATNILL